MKKKNKKRDIKKKKRKRKIEKEKMEVAELMDEGHSRTSAERILEINSYL